MAKQREVEREIAKVLTTSWWELKEKQLVGMDDVGLVNGIVMGIERGNIRALRPLLEKVAKWTITGSPYDNHGAPRAELAATLVRLRARRVLDSFAS